MIMFKSFFLVYSKTYLKIKTFIFCIILLPVLVFLISNITYDDNNLEVGLYLASDGVYEKIISQNLIDNSDINFVCCSSEEELYAKVIDGSFALAYIFTEDFSKDFESINTRNSVELIKLEDDFYYKFINNIVTASIFEEITVYISSGSLDKYDISYDFDTLKEEIEAYSVYGSAFNIEVTTDGEDSLSSNTAFILQLLHGVICLFLLLFAIISAIQLSYSNVNSSLFSPYMSKLKLEIYTLLPIYFYGFISALIAICIIKVNFPSVSLLWEIICLILFELVLFILSIIISRYFKSNILILLTPFILIFVLVSHPIVFDITQFFPSLKNYLQFFPSYQYLINLI